LANLSPMMQQYLAIKEQHKDQILFFRLGDFYEMFFEDAKLASRELELTLTGRDCGLEERAPMCGVPYHSCEIYIKRLIDKGYKVAICEQMENPAEAKGIVKRDIVRIVTPGTVTDNNMLDEARNNYIASIYINKKAYAVSFADVSTGEVHVTFQTERDAEQAVINELSRYMPAEILMNDACLSLKQLTAFIKERLGCVVDIDDAEECKLPFAESVLKTHFVETPELLKEVEPSEEAVISLGVLIQYVNTTQKQGSKRLMNLRVYHNEQYMMLDLNARRNLELTETMRTKEKKGSLLWVLDKTRTSMGKRQLRKVLEQPLLNIAQITRRHSAVQELYGNAILRSRLMELLNDVYDLERLMTRVIFRSAGPRDLKALSFSAARLPEIKEYLSGCTSALLKELNEDIDTMQDIRNVVDKAIKDQPPVNLKEGGVINDGFNQELDELRGLYTNAKTFIAAIEEREKEKTGIKNLKIGYNRVFGYYIEVTKSYLELVPETYIRKQTLANCERYITQELKDLESKVLHASERMIVLEQGIFDELCIYVAKKLTAVQATASALAMLDVLCSFAEVSFENQYVCPQFTTEDKIEIKDGRHPVVERLSGGMFVPNDAYFDASGNRVLIITGPNMAGKSTYMRQNALILLMAQIGCFVPARSATLTVVDKIFTRVGASDDLASGQSTFMVEMSEVSDILHNATSRSFIILDEIGRGTSTFDGMSIARAVIEYIINTRGLKTKTMFATHYHELTALEQLYPCVKNYNIAVKKRGDDITFLRKIIPGGADDSYGIEVAKLAGVPKGVINRAKEVLQELEEGAGTPAAVTQKVPSDIPAQISFGPSNQSKVVEKIKSINLDTLTPIEALNSLFELKKLLD
jgi:DNA mismatch repair protein MutS